MTMSVLKTIHICCAVISYTLFVLRGIWSLNDSNIMRRRWIRIAPHVNDTLLLSTALALAYSIGQYPFIDAWLTAKFAALLLYIGLGSVALKYGRNKTLRIYAWLAAQAVFGYIVLVAISHDPLPFID